MLALTQKADGTGSTEPLTSFITNPAGAAIVSAPGPIRQLARGGSDGPRRYLAILPGSVDKLGAAVQVEAE